MANHLKENNAIVRSNSQCSGCTFSLDYEQNGNKPQVRGKITQMAVNGSGIRDLARLLSVSTHIVMKTLKKTPLNRKRQSPMVREFWFARASCRS
ncbi:MAG TPA: IS1-like element transposase [Coleofasciculaceae cyanobacterium]|jgi:transposase-like protein